MNLERFSLQFLLTLSSLLGVSPTPPVVPSAWTVELNWQEVDGHPRLEAVSAEIPQECRRHPDSYLSFPMVIHGAHSVWLDDRLIAQHGDATMRSVRTFYGAPVLACRDLVMGQVIKWRVDSYSQYFARVPSFPELVRHRPVHNVLAESAHVIGTGGALMMAIFALTLFLGKVGNQLLLSIVIACLGVSIYFASTVSGLMGLQWNMISAHRFGDIGVWIGMGALINALRLESLVANKVAWIFFSSVAVSLFLIASGNNGDVIQFGTSFPFTFSVAMLAYPLANVIKTLRNSGHDRKRLLQAFALMTFVLTCLNEMLVISGVINSSPVLPLGFLSGIFLLSLAVNERINETYQERDYLRENLEAEVQRKTHELRTKTHELETAMDSLRATQAELVQSAKLASLGTLSAGIAHEINNSLNYVNGALQPLEKLIQKTVPAEDRAKIDRLIGVMREGLSLTLEIIKSLRNYTGLNQAKFNDVNLKSVVQSSLTILRNKTRGKIEIEIALPDDLSVFGSVVGINQVFMNLISNAIDSMPNGGQLTITCSLQNTDWTEVHIQDTGVGMSPETAARIFEPFFTTKDVGKGTGLGLHIVRGEMERHKGDVAVQSTPGRGTTFTLRFPAPTPKAERVAA